MAHSASSKYPATLYSSSRCRHTFKSQLPHAGHSGVGKPRTSNIIYFFRIEMLRRTVFFGDLSSSSHSHSQGLISSPLAQSNMGIHAFILPPDYLDLLFWTCLFCFIRRSTSSSKSSSSS
jgi:hypothetical protein